MNDDSRSHADPGTTGVIRPGMRPGIRHRTRPRTRGRGTLVEPVRGPVAALLLVLVGMVVARAACGDDHERGDVPGWVMITLMSAVLVAALLAIAAPALQGLFEQAIQQVQPRR